MVTAVWIKACIEVEQVMSHLTNMAVAPSCVRASRVVREVLELEVDVDVDVVGAREGRGSGRRSEQIIVAPSEAKARAMARPMPEEEPVIMEILFWRRPGMVVGDR